MIFKKKYSLAIISFLSIISLFSVKHIRFDLAPGRAFPNNEHQKIYSGFQNRFSSQMDEESVLIALENASGIFQQQFLQKVNMLTQYVSSLPNIRKVYSITNANLIFFKDNKVNARPLIHIDKPQLYKADSLYLFNSPEYRELLVSRNGRSIAVAAFNEQNLTQQQKNSISDSVMQKLRSLRFDSYHCISKTTADRVFKKILFEEAGIFAFIFLILTLILSRLLFHSVMPAFLVYTTVFISCLWTVSLLHAFGKTLDLPTLFIAVFISVQYFLVLFMGFKNPPCQGDKVTGQTMTLRIDSRNILALAVFAIPLLLFLVSSSIPMVKAFGLYCTVAEILSAVIFIILSPYFLDEVTAKTSHSSSVDNKLVSDSLSFLNRRKYLPLFGTASLLFAVISYLAKPKIEPTIFHHLPASSDLLNNFKFFEKDFSGVRPFEMELSLRSKKNSFFDVEFMRQVEVIERYLKDSCSVGSLISPLSLFRAANKAFNAGELSHYKLPPQPNVSRLYQAIMQSEHADEMDRYMLSDGSGIRISGRMPDVAKKVFDDIERRFHLFFIRNIDFRNISYQLTGPAILLDDDARLAVDFIWKQFFIGVPVMLLIFFSGGFKRFKNLSVFVTYLFPVIVLYVIADKFKMSFNTETQILLLVSFLFSACISLFFLSQLSAFSGKITLQKAIYQTCILCVNTACFLLPLSILFYMSRLEVISAYGQLLFTQVGFILALSFFVLFIDFRSERAFRVN